MTTEELVTIIELRHKLKREITDEEIQSIRSLSTDPKSCYVDVLNSGMPVKRYTSKCYDVLKYDIEDLCNKYRRLLKQKGYRIKSFRYIDYDGNVVQNSIMAESCRFSIAFINPKIKSTKI